MLKSTSPHQTRMYLEKCSSGWPSSGSRTWLRTIRRIIRRTLTNSRYSRRQRGHMRQIQCCREETAKKRTVMVITRISRRLSTNYASLYQLITVFFVCVLSPKQLHPFTRIVHTHSHSLHYLSLRHTKNILLQLKYNPRCRITFNFQIHDYRKKIKILSFFLNIFGYRISEPLFLIH